MLSVLVKLYIKNRARKSQLVCAENVEELLENEVRQFPDRKADVVFSWLMDVGSKMPNASATIPGVVFINSEWAARIVLYQEDERMHDAFRLTLGHELTHQEHDYFYLKPCTKQEKFVYWVNEVHADFGGIQKAFSGSAKRGVAALQYKKQCKVKKDRDSYTHPSWENRMRFVSEYDFDETLIREVAEMVDCKDEVLIDRVCQHFEVIKLQKEQ